MMSKTILVSGATGKQGGAVVDALLYPPSSKTSFKVLALTRKPQSPAATALANKYSNLTLVGGDLDDCEAIFKSANTLIWGVFSVQLPAGLGVEVEGEERQGKALVDASLAHGVKHFVYASADRGGDENSPNDPTNVPHFASKYNIEKYLQDRTAAEQGRMTWTIIRPTAFMENLQPGFQTKGMVTSLKVTRPRTLPVWWIACKDIGWFAAEAFRKPDEWAGKHYSLAGDKLDLDQLDEIFKEKTGAQAPSTFEFVARLFLWWVPEFGVMMRWLADNPYEVDIPALKKIHPEMTTLGHYLEHEWPKQ